MWLLKTRRVKMTSAIALREDFVRYLYLLLGIVDKNPSLKTVTAVAKSTKFRGRY